MSGRHRPSSLFRSRAVRTPVIVIGALSLIGLGAVVLKSVSADADGCSASESSSQLPPTRRSRRRSPRSARPGQPLGPSVEGDCVRVDVIAKPSYEMATELGTYSGGLVDVAAKPVPTPSDADLPTVWIPESSYWLGRRARDRPGHVRQQRSRRSPSSPIVLAVPEAVARGMEKELGQGIDAAIIKKLALDPAGKLKLGVGRAAPRHRRAWSARWCSPTRSSPPPRTFPLWSRSTGCSAARSTTSTALWQAMGDGSKGMNGAPVSEQALLAHNAGAPVDADGRGPARRRGDARLPLRGKGAPAPPDRRRGCRVPCRADQRRNTRRCSPSTGCAPPMARRRPASRPGTASPRRPSTCSRSPTWPR